MTAEEAMRIEDSLMDVLEFDCRASHSGIFAAALIRAQIEGLEYAYLNADFVPIGARLNECRAALAKLEAPK